MIQDDQNSFARRIKRYASVSTKMTGVLARLASERYLGVPLDRADHAENLKAVLGELKGPLMKIAQLLATIPDALPPEYARELAELQAQAPAMGWPFVKRRMQAELGPHWVQKFAEFDHQAAAAASLGQVHRAKDHKGRLLACKLQYPDMVATIEADLQQLKLLMKAYEAYDNAIQNAEIHQEIGARLHEELDYCLEAKHILLYRTLLAAETQIHIPEPILELSTHRLLTMTWLEGAPLITAKELPLERRNQIARTMFRAWYMPFYHYGVIHGDPHLGNYSIRPDDSVNLLDFGCVRVFNPNFVKGVIDLYFALKNEDIDLAAEAYKNWGFNDISYELIEVLNRWARFLYDPLLHDGIRPIEETHNGVHGRHVLSEVHSQLQRLGGIRPPREFVFMDRAAIGLGSVFLHLRAEVNWYQEFHRLIENFDVSKLENQQNQALAQVEYT